MSNLEAKRWDRTVWLKLSYILKLFGFIKGLKIAIKFAFNDITQIFGPKCQLKRVLTSPEPKDQSWDWRSITFIKAIMFPFSTILSIKIKQIKKMGAQVLSEKVTQGSFPWRLYSAKEGPIGEVPERYGPIGKGYPAVRSHWEKVTVVWFTSEKGTHGLVPIGKGYPWFGSHWEGSRQGWSPEAESHWEKSKEVWPRVWVP